jgi:hypothetical protein
MKDTQGISNSDRINYLNIGLMLISMLVAFYIPFELFLFSYAVLGPLHYLTEISWLHERKYFTKGKRDFWLLVIFSILLFILSFGMPEKMRKDIDVGVYSNALVYMSFAAALAMVLLQDVFHRFIAFLFVFATAFLSDNFMTFFSLFLPTLIHVYLFTGLFMLYGALKERSKTGYLSMVFFVLCPLMFFFIMPDALPLSDYAFKSYQHFYVVNHKLLSMFSPESLGEGYVGMINGVFKSEAGIIVMRFIAFAYTYHYLNWFSKTTVIKWHKIPKLRMGIILLLWVASVAFYWWDYAIGFKVLFCLSFMHVFLEFPLNHTSFIGIFRELRSISSGTPPAAVAKTGKGRKT